MKRSGFGPRKTPMSRGSWKSSPTDTKDWRAELRANPKRSTLKSRPKRPTVAEGSKYLEACRGEKCYLQIPGICRFLDPDETCVPAHRNEGKGVGLKVSNELTCPACFWCHIEYDQGKRFMREEKRDIWNRGYADWVPVRARKLGLVEMEIAE